MKKIQVKHRYRKTLATVITLTGMLLSIAGSCVAANYVALEMYPQHVGVFTTDGVQQFVAFGVAADGSRQNITNQVGWESSNESVVTIDEDGLASIVAGKTYGQVEITCSYPKGGMLGSGVTHLLLRR